MRKVKCPYCNGPMEKGLDSFPLSYKRQKLFDYIVAAGDKGRKFEDVKEEFFPHSVSDVIVRTTIHYMNNTIKPLKIFCRGGIIRLINQ